MDALYRLRDWLGIPPALLVLLLLTAIPARHLIGRVPAGQFEVSIEAPAPLPSPSKPEPAPSTESPPITPPTPKASASRPERDAALPRPKARPVSAPPRPKRELPAPPPAAQTSPPAKEVIEASEPPLPAVPATALASIAPVAPPAPAVLPPPRQEAKGLSVEDAYIAQIRSSVQSRKKYPTGREASMQKPSGTVRACMDLSRAGTPANDIVIERTSHSMILDAEARKLLRTGAYPPFPAGAFPGESTHRFCIHLEYAFQQSG